LLCERWWKGRTRPEQAKGKGPSINATNASGSDDDEAIMDMPITDGMWMATISDSDEESGDSCFDGIGSESSLGESWEELFTEDEYGDMPDLQSGLESESDDDEARQPIDHHIQELGSNAMYFDYLDNTHVAPNTSQNPYNDSDSDNDKLYDPTTPYPLRFLILKRPI
jgi:hypothetical protein